MKNYLLAFSIIFLASNTNAKMIKLENKNGAIYKNENLIVNIVKLNDKSCEISYFGGRNYNVKIYKEKLTEVVCNSILNQLSTE